MMALREKEADVGLSYGLLDQAEVRVEIDPQRGENIGCLLYTSDAADAS